MARLGLARKVESRAENGFSRHLYLTQAGAAVRQSGESAAVQGVVTPGKLLLSASLVFSTHGSRRSAIGAGKDRSASGWTCLLISSGRLAAPILSATRARISSA